MRLSRIPSTRTAPRERGTGFISPEKSDQIARRKATGSHGGRPLAVDDEEYKQRTMVERCFSRLQQLLDLAACAPNRAVYYMPEVTIASIVRWLR